MMERKLFLTEILKSNVYLTFLFPHSLWSEFVLAFVSRFSRAYVYFSFILWLKEEKNSLIVAFFLFIFFSLFFSGFVRLDYVVRLCICAIWNNNNSKNGKRFFSSTDKLPRKKNELYYLSECGLWSSWVLGWCRFNGICASIKTWVSTTECCKRRANGRNECKKKKIIP